MLKGSPFNINYDIILALRAPTGGARLALQYVGETCFSTARHFKSYYETLPFEGKAKIISIVYHLPRTGVRIALDDTTINRWGEILRSLFPEFYLRTGESFTVDARLHQDYVGWLLRLARVIQEQPNAVQTFLYLHDKLECDAAFSLLMCQQFAIGKTKVRRVIRPDYTGHLLFRFNSASYYAYQNILTYRDRLKGGNSYAVEPKWASDEELILGAQYYNIFKSEKISVNAVSLISFNRQIKEIYANFKQRANKGEQKEND